MDKHSEIAEKYLKVNTMTNIDQICEILFNAYYVDNGDINSKLNLVFSFMERITKKQKVSLQEKVTTFITFPVRCSRFCNDLHDQNLQNAIYVKVNQLIPQHDLATTLIWADIAKDVNKVLSNLRQSSKLLEATCIAVARVAVERLYQNNKIALATKLQKFFLIDMFSCTVLRGLLVEYMKDDRAPDIDQQTENTIVDAIKNVQEGAADCRITYFDDSVVDLDARSLSITKIVQIARRKNVIKLIIDGLHNQYHIISHFLP